MEENFFEEISEENNTQSTETKNTDEEENIFITGLPDWDLEPPYEVIRRGESK